MLPLRGRMRFFMAGTLIDTVDLNSPAHRAGILPGEKLVSINGNEVYDILDYRYFSVGRRLLLEVSDTNGKLRKVKIVKPQYTALGLNFASYLMDNPRSCVNNCIFCFIDQLPPGLRETLYFKDDDSRLSFLMGNYITLTNLSKREISRIIELKISPINVSVHATNAELRAFLLRCKKGANGFLLMKRLADAGIQMNCQIVCLPGINDGPELQNSIADLSSLYPSVKSVSVVPVGLTRYREGLYPIKAYEKKQAAEVIDMVDRFGDICLKEYGSRIFFCGDEFYLKAGRALPPYDYYENFPQFENGVGMLRSFENEFLTALDTLNIAPDDSPPAFSVATGTAAEQMLKNLLQILQNKCYNIKGNIYGIQNDFFGSCVDVAGLVTGGDLIAQLKGMDLGQRLLIPASMLRHGGDMFLDNISVSQVSESLNIPVVPVPNDGAQLLSAILDKDIDRTASDL